MWKEINPPISEEDLTGKFFGAIYEVLRKKKKVILFVGRFTRRFLKDANCLTDVLELDSLDLAIGSLIVLNKRPPSGFFSQHIMLLVALLNAIYINGTK